MAFFSLQRWLRRNTQPTRRSAASRLRRSFFKLELEPLEMRLAPATDIWTGVGLNANWNNPTNWNTHQVPQNGDDLVFPSGVATPGLTTTNNLLNAIFNSITFSGSNYNLKGSQITLGSAPGGNSIILSAGAAGNVISFDIVLGGAAGNRQFFTENGGADLTISGHLKGTTGVDLTKDGVGTLVLTNDNSGFTGPITVNQGVLKITNVNALGDTSNGTTVQQNAQLQVSNISSPITESLILNGPGPANDGALRNVAGNTTWAGPIQMDSDTTLGADAGTSLNITNTISDLGAGHNLTKEGAGTIIFSAANSYRGTTTINNGILDIRNAGALGTADGTLATGTTVNQSTTEVGTLELEDPTGVGFTVANEVLTLNGAGVLINNNPIGALDNINGNNVWTGPVILGSPSPNGSDVSIGAEATDPATSLTISGVISDPNGRNNPTKVGGGTLIFTSANTYHGTTLVFAGILDIRDSNALGATHLGTTVLAGATLQLDVDALPDSVTGTTNTLVVPDPLFLAGTGVNGLGALRSASGTNVYTGTIRLSGETSIGVDPDPNPSNNLGYFPTYNNQGFAVTGDYSLTVRGQIIGTGGAQLDKSGAGQLILPFGNPRFIGTVDIQNGWITIQNNQSLGAPVTIASSGAVADQNLQPTVTVEEGASLHLKPLNAGGSLQPTQNFVLYGQGIVHPFGQINQEGALLSLDGVNTVAGNIELGDQVGIGSQLLDPGSFPAGQLYITGYVSQTPSILKLPTASGNGNFRENDGKPFFVGNNGGTVIITANMFPVPDDMRVYYGPRGTPGSTIIYDNTTSNYPTQFPTAANTATVTIIYSPTSATATAVETGNGSGWNPGGTVGPYGPITNGHMQIIMNEVVNGVGNGDGSGAWTYQVTVIPNNLVGGITKLGSQLVVLQDDGTFTGPVDIKEGVLLDQSNTGLGKGTQTTVESGAALALANTTPADAGGLRTGIEVWGQDLLLNGPGNDTLLPPGSSTPIPLAPLTVLSNNSITGSFDTIVPTDTMWRGPATLGTSVAIDVQPNSRLSVYGGIDDAPNPSPAGSDLIKVDAGELVLDGSGSYRGTTYVGTSSDPDGINEFFASTNPQPLPGGVLTVANSQALGASSGGTVVDQGSAIQLQGNITVAGESLTIQGQGTATVPTPAPANWFQVGPAPIADGQTLAAAGPVAGRITGIATDPTDPQTIYVSTAGGGAWKTINGGLSWLPLFDSTAAMATGAIAVSPLAPNIIYLGTGEADNSTDSLAGTGVYQSTDGGLTWTLLTSPSNGANPIFGKAVSKIIADPFNLGTLYVADSDQAINGTPATAAAPVGVWRYDPVNGWVCLTDIVSAVRSLGSSVVTRPKGFPDQTATPTPPPKTPGPDDYWDLSFPNSNADYSDLAMLTNVTYNIGDNLTAGAAEVLYMAVDGVGGFNADSNAVYRCINPTSNQPIWDVGDGNLLDTASPPNTVYDKGGTGAFPTNISVPTFRNGNIKITAVGSTIYTATTDPVTQAFKEIDVSTDTGETWKAVSPIPQVNYMGTQGHYDSAILASSATTLFVGGENNILENLNPGGLPFVDISVDSKGNGPHAAFHALALDGNETMLAATDGGIWSYDLVTKVWTDINGNLAISLLNSVGIDQANSSAGFASSQASGTDAFANNPAWTMADDNAGASSYGALVRVDPTNLNNVYAVVTTTAIANEGPGATPVARLRGSANGGTSWTTLFTQTGLQTFPFLVDSINPNRLLIGGTSVYESLDQGNSWLNLGPPQGSVTALAAATYQGTFVQDVNFPQVVDQGTITYDPNTIYATDGRSIVLTKDHGVSWADITITNQSGSLGSFADIEVDPSNRDTAYVVRRSGDINGRVFETTDAGHTWTDLTFNLPAGLAVNKLVVDPRSSQLVVGTDLGVYALDSTTQSWSLLGAGLPLVRVTDMALDPSLNTLTIATYGRGMYQIWLNSSQVNAGVLRAVSGSAVWTGPVYLAGPTTISADGAPVVGPGVPNARLNIIGTVSDLTSGANYPLTKIGGGTVTLSGSNTYGGVTLVQQGVLAVHNPQALGGTTNGTIVSLGAALQLQSSVENEPLTLYGIGPAPGLNQHPTGALENVSNNNSYTGPITLVETANPNSGMPLGVIIGVDSGSELAITGSISGTVDPSLPAGTPVTLTKELTGTLALAGANTYNGVTLVNQGALQVESAGALGTTSAGTVVVDGAQLQMQSEQLQIITLGGKTTGSFTLAFNGQTTSSLAYSSTAAQVQAALNSLTSIGGVGGAVTVTLSGTVFTVAFQGTLGGIIQPALIAVGAGGTTVAVASVFGPPVVVTGETVTLSGTGIFGTGAMLDTGGNNVWQGPVFLTRTPAVAPPTNPSPLVTFGVANAGDTLYIADSVGEVTANGATSFGLTKVGPGKLVLEQADTYSNVTTVAAGILTIQNTGGLGTAGGPPNHGAVVDDNATLQLDLDPLNTGTPQTITGETLTLNGLGANGIGALDNLSGNNTWAGAPVILNDSTAIGVNGGALTVTGDIQGVPASALSKVGTGTLFLPTANDYQGTTNVLNGILNIANSKSLGGTVTSEVETVTLSGAQTGTFTLTFNNQTTTSLAFNAPATGPGSVQQALDALSSIGGVGGSVSVSQSGNTYTITFGGSLAGILLPPLTANPSTGTNSVVNVVTPGGLGGTVVAAGGTLQLANNITVTGEPLQLTGAGYSGPGALDSVSGTNKWDSLVTLAGNASITANIDPTLGPSVLTIDQAIGESVTGSNLTKLGTGAVILSGPASNTYTGVTSVADGLLRLSKSGGATAVPGDLVVGDGTPASPFTDVVQLTAGNQLASTSNVTVNTDGLLDLNGQTQTVASLTMTGGTTSLTGVASQLTVTGGVTGTSDSGGAPATISGTGHLVLAPIGTATATVFTLNPGGGSVDMQVAAVITGSGIGLTKTGAGTLDLTATNTYTGTTTVTKGTLLADGMNPANTIGPVTLNGGTLGGQGTVGPVTAGNAGGTVAPGDNAPGVLTVAGDVLLNAKSSYFAIIDGNTAVTTYNQLVVNGNVTLGNAKLTGLVASNFAPAVNVDTFTLIQTTGTNHTISGTFSSGPTVVFGGYKFAITYNSTSVVITRVSVTTTTGVAVAPSAGVPNTTFTITVTVTPQVAGILTPGSVTLTVVGPSFNQTYNPQVVGHQATVTLQSLIPGTYTVTSAQYTSSDSGVGNSQAPTTPSFTVARDTTTLGASATPNSPSVYGQPVTFQMTVTPGTSGPILPTQTVTFTDGNTALPNGTVSVTNNNGTVSASYTTSALAVGQHQINGIYSGDSNYLGTSTSLSYTVDQANATVSVASSGSPAVFGQPVITATVSPQYIGTPTGSVTFAVLNATTNTSTTEQDALSGGVATLQQVLVPGSYQITASYSGDGNFLNQPNSNTLAQAVIKANSAVTVASSNTNSVYGQAVITAAVTPVAPGAGNSTGTVTFSVLNTATNAQTTEQDSLVGGVATMQQVLGPGSYQITASYGGDPNFNGRANSNTVNQTVAKASTTTTVASSSLTAVYGQAAITATVAAVAPGAGTPTGTVTFAILNTATNVTTTEQDALSGGVATLQQVLVPGSYQITANYSGDSNFLNPPNANTITQTVNMASTTVTVASTKGTAVYGQAVITATVAAVSPGVGTPTGSVTFAILNKSTNTTTTEQDTLTAGSATLHQVLNVGSYTITASYSGDGNFSAPANSNALTQTVNQAGTRVTVASTVTTALYGQAAITATVAAVSLGAGTPTGTVTFAILNISTNTITTEQDTLAGGSAALQQVLGVGSYQIRASYGGDPNFQGQPNSNVINQTVNQASATVTVVTTGSPAVYGQAVITATVSPVSPAGGTPTGSVTFAILNTATNTTTTEQDALAGGSATLQQVLNVGSYTITASYSGDANFFSNPNSNAVSQTVNPAATTTKVTSSTVNNTSVYGQPVTFTATVSAGASLVSPPGTMTFFIDGVQQSPDANVVNGQATLTVTNFAIRATPYAISATYNPPTGGNFMSSSGGLSGGQTVTQATPSVVVAASLNPSAFGQSVTFSASITPPFAGTPGGTANLVITDNQGHPVQQQSTVAVSADAVVFAPVANLGAAGSPYTVQVVYNGDPNFAGTNAVLTGGQIVNQDATATTVISSSTNNTSNYGSPVTFTATVTNRGPGSGTPGGSVNFFDGASTTPLNATPVALTTVAGQQQASFTTTALQLTGGQHAITAVYLGNPNFATSTSSALTQTVNLAATTTADVTASFTTPPSTPVYGQSITFSTKVTAAANLGNFTGAVEFLDNGSTLIGSTTVNGSGTVQASLPVSNLTVGTHSITALYLGNINFAQSSSPDALAQQVNPDNTTTAIASTNPSAVYGGDSVTATISPVSPGVLIPTGSVTFTVVNTAVTPNTTTTETDPVVSGVATLSVLPPGSYSITTAYQPANDLYNPSTSGTLAQTVSQDTTTVALATSNSSTFFGQQVTFTAAISPTTPSGGFVAGASVPSGTVTFKSGATALGQPVTLQLVNGTLQAVLPIANVPVGANQTITAQYNGDTNYSGNSNTVQLTVTAATTATALASSSASNTSSFGQAVTFTATITLVQGGGLPPGTVNFYDGTVVPANLIGSGTVGTVGGQQQASFTTQPTQLAIGTHQITAVYTDTADSNYVTSTSSALTQTVTPVGTFSALQSSRITPVLGHPVTFTATVSTVIPNLGTPTGSVVFLVDNSPTTVGLTNGQATLTLTTLSLGNHTVGVSYAGNSFFLGNTSKTLSFTVLTPNQGFVAQVYRDLLGREVDAGGLAGWSNLLNQGALTRTQVVSAITASTEYHGDVIDAEYVLYLHRHADPGGLANFEGAMAAGVTDEQVAAILIGSPEYYNNRGRGTVTGFLTALYSDALGRPIDSGGLQSFTQLLAANGSRQQVAADILASTEYEQDLVTSYYNKFLHRNPDAGGLAAWVNGLAHGTTDEIAIASIVGSDEYYNNL